MEGGYHESLERALQPLEQLDRKALEYVARDLPLSKRQACPGQACTQSAAQQQRAQRGETTADEAAGSG